ncbi:MAG: hypothetical protein GY724_09545 [Actinomycetia bacterium]|nr:hypothetical protein [Actinomycetes bacterium]MCP5032216.1 hypothetical protein [Actinomycetes bacterium]
MRLLPKTPSRRFRTIGLLSDVAMVAAAGMRVARRSKVENARSNDPGELVLLAGASWRLLRRIRKVRHSRRARRLASTD